MKEKQHILNEYAKSLGCGDWELLLYDFINDESIYRADAITEHVMKVIDIIQKKSLERASENVKTKMKSNIDELSMNDDWREIDKESITNENNLIK